MEDKSRKRPHVPSWDELQELLDSARSHPEIACWGIYRHLNAHYKELGSEASRTLLATYMTIPHEQPSQLHSCILSVAVKIAYEYPDFRFCDFLRYWGYSDKLRPEDRRVIVLGERTIPSLFDRTERARQFCLLRQSGEKPLMPDGSTYVGDREYVMPMVAVKVWERDMNGKRLRSVKLVGQTGHELMADSRLFFCKPLDIYGRLFDVLVRNNGERETVRRANISARKIEDVFPPVVGFIKNYDDQHRFFHIYDAQSRHFVAELPPERASAGSYVMFSPIIPERDKFKSAIITKALNADEGRQLFGTYEAEVTYANAEKGFFSYKIISPLRPTPEGTATAEGTASTHTPGIPVEGLAVGQRIRVVMFLTRRRDKTKQNFVAEVIPLS